MTSGSAGEEEKGTGKHATQRGGYRGRMPTTGSDKWISRGQRRSVWYIPTRQHTVGVVWLPRCAWFTLPFDSCEISGSRAVQGAGVQVQAGQSATHRRSSPVPGRCSRTGTRGCRSTPRTERKPSSLPVQVSGSPQRSSTTSSGEGLLTVDDRSRPTAARRRSTAEESLQSTLSPRVGAPFPPPPKVPREGGLGVLQTECIQKNK